MSAAFAALPDDEIQPRLLVGDRLLDLAAQRPDQPTAVLNQLDLVSRRGAQRIGDQPALWPGQGLLQQRRCGGLCPPQQTHGVAAVWPFRNAGIRKQLLGKVDVLLGHHLHQLCLELLRGHVPHALVLFRDHNVHPVWLVANVGIDPVQFLLELLGREAHRAEHTDTTGLAHGNDHVPAVGKGENRVFHADSLAKHVLHDGFLHFSSTVSSFVSGCRNVLDSQPILSKGLNGRGRT